MVHACGVGSASNVRSGRTAASNSQFVGAFTPLHRMLRLVFGGEVLDRDTEMLMCADMLPTLVPVLPKKICWYIIQLY